MSRVVRLTLDAVDGLAAHIDLIALEAPIKAALQNVTIYLGYAVHATAGEPLASLRLDSKIRLDVGVADPVPLARRDEYQQQFRQWAIGQALTEIDQSYARFLISSLEAKADLISFRDHKRLVDHRLNNSNTWTLHEQFFRSAPARDHDRLRDAEYLRTLGNARNCLAHDSGIVTERRLIDGQSMAVRWPGRDMYQETEEGRSQLLDREGPFTVAPEDVGSRLTIKSVIREHIYKLGDRVTLSGADLHEIIFFYQILAMTVGAEMHRFVEDLCVQVNAPQT